MRSLPVQAFIENIALTPCGLGDLQSDTAATPWLFVAVRKLAYKSKDWKGFVALLLSKHMDEMLNSVLKMYWFTFSHKDRLFKRKTINYSNVYIETKSKGNWLTQFEEKAERFCFSPVKSSLSFLLQHMVIVTVQRPPKKSGKVRIKIILRFCSWRQRLNQAHFYT